MHPPSAPATQLTLRPGAWEASAPVPTPLPSPPPPQGALGELGKYQGSSPLPPALPRWAHRPFQRVARRRGAPSAAGTTDSKADSGLSGKEKIKRIPP